MTTHPHANAWFPYQRATRNGNVRLFCLPYAGGGASIYRSWSEQLPAEIEVWPIQLPGRENRMSEPPTNHIMDLVNRLVLELLPHLDKPYAFFGHSMGASISFELAHALRRHHLSSDLVHLFVSGRRAPQVHQREPFTYTLPEPEFIEELRRLNGTPETVLQHAELLQLLLPVLRADFQLSETYTYQFESPLPFPISAYGGLQDTDITREDLEAWQKETSSLFTIRMFLGTHFFVHSAQTNLLQILARDLLLEKPSVKELRRVSPAIAENPSQEEKGQADSCHLLR